MGDKVEEQAPAPAATNVTPPTPPAPVAAAVEPTPTPTPSEDDFAAAFADLHKDPAPAAPAAAPAATPTPAPATGAATPAAPPAAAPAAEPAPAAPAAPAAPDGFVAKADVQAMIDAALAARQPAPAAPAAAPAADPAPAAPPPMYTPDEQTTLTKYQQEWPDVAAGEALARRAEYHHIVQHVFNEVGKLITPMQEALGRMPALEADTQYRALTEIIPDYDTVRDPVIEWVAKQPAYLKTAYEQVTASGSPEDIADLVERFKKDTGWTAPAAAAPAAASPAATPAAPVAAAPAAAAPAATPAAAPAVSPAAAAAAAALKPVASGRSQPAASADPNDFEGAWKEFSTADAK